MKLTDLNPRWCSHDAEGGRSGVSFQCPHCVAGGAPSPSRLAIFFDVPIDGGSVFDHSVGHAKAAGVLNEYPGEILWHREGDTFETLTLSPSVDASRFGHWHGFIRNGEVT